MKTIKQIIQSQKTTGFNSEPHFPNEQLSVLRKLLSGTIKQIVPDFIFDEYNESVIENLFYYFIKQKGGLDLNKGIWLMGGNGTGKTSLLQIFSEFGRKRFDGFKMFDCAKVANDYAATGDLDIYTYNQNGYSGRPVNMAFDELGRETIPAIYFGQKLNIMQHILHIRYNLWRSVGVQTYITTNCDAREIHELYDNSNDRFITDRIREMYNVIHLGGISRRK